MTTTIAPQVTAEEQAVIDALDTTTNKAGTKVVELVRAALGRHEQKVDEFNQMVRRLAESGQLQPNRGDAEAAQAALDHEADALDQTRAAVAGSSDPEEVRQALAEMRAAKSKVDETLDKLSKRLDELERTVVDHDRAIYGGEAGKPGLIATSEDHGRRITALEQGRPVTQPVASSSPVQRNERRFNRPVAVRIACIIGVLAMVAGFLVSFFTNQGVVQTLFVGAAAGIAAALATLFVAVLINTFARPTNAPA